MNKRKHEEEHYSVKQKQQKNKQIKKYSLDSDEEDETEDANNVLDDNDIEGEEEGIASNVGEERFTAFNMREEMEEGHFDKNGHFIWSTEKEVRDNWLDNIDWQKIDHTKNKKNEVRGLGSDSDESEIELFEETQYYLEILTYLKPNESINKALNRLGGQTKKLSSIERLKRKKAGLLESNAKVTKLTELVDKIMSETGNMDIYQETYEMISKKINDSTKKNKAKAAVEAELDMYSDDFDIKEKAKLGDSAASSSKEEKIESSKEIQWEFKRDLQSNNIEGPYSTLQMIMWSKEGYFKTGAWARKRGEDLNFYSTNRMDFELYL